MPAMVARESHLWVSVVDIGEKESDFLLDVLVLPSELFGTSVEMVVRCWKLREAKVWFVAFKTYIPCRSRSTLQASEDTKTGPEGEGRH